jgi:Mpv17 / PMP22 family
LRVCLQGQPGAIVPTVKEKLVPTLKAGYALWPVAHLINFRFVPQEQRVLYVNVVQVSTEASAMLWVWHLERGIWSSCGSHT